MLAVGIGVMAPGDDLAEADFWSGTRAVDVKATDLRAVRSQGDILHRRRAQDVREPDLVRVTSTGWAFLVQLT